MRGHTDRQLSMFDTFEVEDRIRPDHPLRDIKRRTDRILAALHARFDAAYSTTGRPSIPPERLLKALLLMALYSDNMRLVCPGQSIGMVSCQSGDLKTKLCPMRS